MAAAALPGWPALAAAAGGAGGLATALVAGVVMAVLLALAGRRRRGDLDKLPGPRQVPLLGNIELADPQASGA